MKRLDPRQRYKYLPVNWEQTFERLYGKKVVKRIPTLASLMERMIDANNSAKSDGNVIIPYPAPYRSLLLYMESTASAFTRQCSTWIIIKDTKDDDTYHVGNTEHPGYHILETTPSGYPWITRFQNYIPDGWLQGGPAGIMPNSGFVELSTTSEGPGFDNPLRNAVIQMPEWLDYGIDKIWYNSNSIHVFQRIQNTLSVAMITTKRGMPYSARLPIIRTGHTQIESSAFDQVEGRAWHVDASGTQRILRCFPAYLISSAHTRSEMYGRWSEFRILQQSSSDDYAISSVWCIGDVLCWTEIPWDDDSESPVARLYMWNIRTKKMQGNAHTFHAGIASLDTTHPSPLLRKVFWIDVIPDDAGTSAVMVLYWMEWDLNYNISLDQKVVYTFTDNIPNAGMSKNMRWTFSDRHLLIIRTKTIGDIFNNEWPFDVSAIDAAENGIWDIENAMGSLMITMVDLTTMEIVDLPQSIGYEFLNRSKMMIFNPDTATYQPSIEDDVNLNSGTCACIKIIPFLSFSGWGFIRSMIRIINGTIRRNTEVVILGWTGPNMHLRGGTEI